MKRAASVIGFKDGQGTRTGFDSGRFVSLSWPYVLPTIGGRDKTTNYIITLRDFANDKFSYNHNYPNCSYSTIYKRWFES